MACQTATEGDACSGHVRWAMESGFDTNPGWYPGLTRTSSFESFQGVISISQPDCGQPCPIVPISDVPSPSPLTPSSYIRLEGACRTQTGGAGDYVVVEGGNEACAERCAADANCVAYETDFVSRCELHKVGTTIADSNVQGFACWFKGEVPSPDIAGVWGYIRLDGACRTQAGGVGDYDTTDPVSEPQCRQTCSDTLTCVAFEVNSGGRCELHRSGTSRSDATVANYDCLVKAAMFNLVAGACRTQSGGGGDFSVIDASEEECRDVCSADSSCIACETNAGGRCELHRPGTVRTDETVANYKCWFKDSEDSLAVESTTTASAETLSATPKPLSNSECQAVWNSDAVDRFPPYARYTCGARIEWLKSWEGGSQSDIDAMETVALAHSACLACWPWEKYKVAGDMRVSPKRGIAISNSKVTIAALPQLATMSSWTYNWGYGTSPSDQQGSPTIAQWDGAGVKWKPMLWNEQGLIIVEEISASLGWNSVGTRSALLAFNEPNYANQANMSPQKAAELWPRIEQLAARFGISKIVAPAVGFSDLWQGTDWLGEFFDLCRGCKVDAIAFHSYTCYAQFLKDHIDMYRSFGKPIWLTEFACAEGGDLNAPRLSAQGQMEYMREAIPMLERDPDIEMYSWFSFFSGEWEIPIDNTNPDAGLIRADGSLSELGQLYASFAF